MQKRSNNDTAGDEKSKNLFRKGLEFLGHKVIDCDKNVKKGVKRADLKSVKDGIIYTFELKQRSFDSDQYSTMIITDDKAWIKSPRSYYVFFYTDGWGCIVRSTEKPFMVDKKYTQATTRFDRKNMVLKTYLHYLPEQGQWFRFDPKRIY